MKKAFTKQNGIFILMYSFAANSFALINLNIWVLLPVLIAMAVVNTCAGLGKEETRRARLVICRHGAGALTVFGGTFFPSLVYHIIALIFLDTRVWLYSFLFMAAATSVLFINGIVSVYTASVQLGIRWRVLGIVCAPIPVINLMILTIIIATVLDEVEFEIKKE